MSDANPNEKTGSEQFKEKVQATQASTPAAATERELWAGTYSSRAMMPNWFIAGLITVLLAAVGIWLMTAEQIPAWYGFAACLGVAVVTWISSFLLLGQQPGAKWLVEGVITVLLLVLGGWLALGLGEAGAGWNVLLACLGAAAAVWIFYWLVLIIRQWSRHYQITTQRIIHQEGIINRSNDRIEIIDVDDVSFHQNLVERVFGVGSITIESSDQSHPVFVMQGVADVNRVTNIIDDARRDERRRRGVRIVE